MGGKDFCEYLVIVLVGEDIIVYLDVSDYVVNFEMVWSLYVLKKLYVLLKDMEKIDIFGVGMIDELVEFLKVGVD